MNVVAHVTDKSTLNVDIDVPPDTCPFCKKKCHPTVKYALVDDARHSPRVLQVVVQCPSTQCRRLFIATYRVEQAANVYGIHYGHLMNATTLVYDVKRTFSRHVQDVSPSFCDIYREAEIAEQNELLLVCGAGYRKALEFLIKDFIIKHLLADHPEEHERIKEAFLGTCITKYIDNPQIRAAAERAAWLGNDETHYVRRWEDRDLNDLKRLINMTVSWIELVLESAAYQEAMPDGKSDQQSQR